jgi:hypothetical protein
MTWPWPRPAAPAHAGRSAPAAGRAGGRPPRGTWRTATSWPSPAGGPTPAARYYYKGTGRHAGLGAPRPVGRLQQAARHLEQDNSKGGLAAVRDLAHRRPVSRLQQAARHLQQDIIIKGPAATRDLAHRDQLAVSSRRPDPCSKILKGPAATRDLAHRDQLAVSSRRPDTCSRILLKGPAAMQDLAHRDQLAVSSRRPDTVQQDIIIKGTGRHAELGASRPVGRLQQAARHLQQHIIIRELWPDHNLLKVVRFGSYLMSG